MASQGISGKAVAGLAIGGFLVYAGIKDVDVITGFRDILQGRTPVGRAQKTSADFSRAAGTAAGQGVAEAAAGVGAAALVAAAKAKLGAKYVFGAVGPTTYDCSGLVVACLREIKVNNGKVSRFVTQTFAVWARANGYTKVDEKNIRAGDIVLKPGHMGIAVSNTEMIHAPHTGSVVKYGKIYTPRYMWSGWRMPNG